MAFSPRFTYIDAIVRDLLTIERARAVVEVLPLPPDRALAMRQAARQRATASSTAIEGNNLQSAALVRAVAQNDRSPSDMEQEVRNYWRALEWIEERVEARASFDLDFIQELHRIIIVRGRGRRGLRSEWRSVPCPVVNTLTREIEYAPPRQDEVPGLMHDLVRWLASPAAAALPPPVRAAILAHRFVSIHPFDDGNGRTTRALATAELWRSGYDLRGFLSLEEHFAADRETYYRRLQLGLPVDFYDGRHDPDHTPWIAYVLGVMATAADAVRRQAENLYSTTHPQEPVWSNLARRQQQLLTRLLTRGLDESSPAVGFDAGDLEDWYGISRNTAHEWLAEWQTAFVAPADPEAKRVRQWVLAAPWHELVAHSIAEVFRQRRPQDKPTDKPTEKVD